MFLASLQEVVPNDAAAPRPLAESCFLFRRGSQSKLVATLAYQVRVLRCSMARLDLLFRVGFQVIEKEGFCNLLDSVNDGYIPIGNKDPCFGFLPNTGAVYQYRFPPITE